MSNASEVRALEEKLLRPDFRRNREAVAELLADDFREFGNSGRVWNKQQILDRLESEAPFDAEMRDFDVMELARGVILATYKVTVKDRTSLRSSIWVKHDECWQILFHQGTITRSSPEFMEDIGNMPVQEGEF